MDSKKRFICFQFLLICAITLTNCYPRYPPSEYMDLYLDEEKQRSPQLIPLVPIVVQSQPQPEHKFYIVPYKQPEKKSSDEDDDHDSDDSEQDSEPSLKEFMPNDGHHRKTRTRCTKKVLYGDDPQSQRPRRSEPNRSPSWNGMSDSPPRPPPKHYDVHVGKPVGKGRVRKFRKGYKIDFVENTDIDDSPPETNDQHFY